MSRSVSTPPGPRSSDLTPAPWTTTATLARHCGLWHEEGVREIKLELLARQLGTPIFTPHHASGDAMTTAVLLLVLATRLGAERGRVRTRDLVELSRRGARAH